MQATEAHREADRLMTICNACRYCEGLCAVFPAMEMRRQFAAPDLDYLANLCHQCGACYADCQYAPPHEFAVNVPSALSRTRTESYERYVWPRGLAVAFARNGVITALALVGGLVALTLAVAAFQQPGALLSRNAGDFYRVLPHGAMVAIFGAALGFALLSIAISLVRYWRDIKGDTKVAIADVVGAVTDAGRLRYLDGGGRGCSSEGEQPSNARRTFHHLTVYGFLLCFAATSVATVYHYGLGWKAPYALTSVPVFFGIVGGLGLLVGPAGLYALSRNRDAALTDARSTGLSTVFIAMLFLVSLTGFAVMLWRDTAAMGLLLIAHLSSVLALFVGMPYGKFVHGFYRFLALVKYNAERRRGAFVD